MAGRPGNYPVDVLDKGTLWNMNFNVLRRIEPETEQLLATAGHVALYDFNQAAGKWAHKGVEGTLFLIKRRSQPFYQYIVLNKKSQDHYVEDILDSFKFEHLEREGKIYLLYKNRQNEVIGIWFYDTAECDKVVTLLKRITASQPPSVAEAMQPAATAPVSASKQAPAAPLMKNAKSVPAANGSAGGRGEDSFWDTGTTGSAPEELLLRQDGQKPKPGTSAPVTETTPLLTPGGLESAGKPNALERLFGGMGRTQAPAGAPPPPPSVATPQVKGLPPFVNAEEAVVPSPAHHTPSASSTTAAGRSASASAFSTPAGAQKGGNEEPATAPSGSQLPSQPALLKPSFFQGAAPPAGAAATPKESSGEPAPSYTPSKGPSAAGGAAQGLTPSKSQDAFLKLFAPKGSAVKEAASTPNLVSDNGSREAAKGPAVRHHALVRAAVKALADSDEFIEVLVRELEKSGLLQDNPTLS